MKTVRTSDGDSVPDLLWRLFKRDDDQAEEAVYKLNPKLCEYGAVLPAGITITFPEFPTVQAKKVVNVWD